jgi:NADH dehydrogenase FAD-containing subunit
LNFPEVFAAGDCAVIQSHPLPQTAQIAYQQGASIADNIMALSNGKPIQPIRAKLRGTLMKPGIHKSVANLFDKI